METEERLGGVRLVVAEWSHTTSQGLKRDPRLEAAALLQDQSQSQVAVEGCGAERAGMSWRHILRAGEDLGL